MLKLNLLHFPTLGYTFPVQLLTIYQLYATLQCVDTKHLSQTFHHNQYVDLSGRGGGRDK